MVMTNDIARLKSSVAKANRDAVQSAAIEWRNGIVEVLTGNRTGRRYKIGKNAFYTASRAGEAPASRTGKLRSSYRFRIITDSEAEVGSPLEYSYFLEKGTRRMAPRPHVIVGFERKRKEIEAAIGKGFTLKL